MLIMTKLEELEKLREEINNLSELNKEYEIQLFSLEERVRNQSITLKQAVEYLYQWREYIISNEKLINIMKEQIRRVLENGKS